LFSSNYVIIPIPEQQQQHTIFRKNLYWLDYTVSKTNSFYRHSMLCFLLNYCTKALIVVIVGSKSNIKNIKCRIWYIITEYNGAPYEDQYICLINGVVEMYTVHMLLLHYHAPPLTKWKWFTNVELPYM